LLEGVQGEEMTFKAIPVYLAFLAMGFVDAVGPFMSLAKNEFLLSTAVASLIPFVGLSMFGLLSIPAGILQSRYGEKLVLMMGLFLTLVGVLNASFGQASFLRLILTMVLVGAGAASLQVAGNPIMQDISAKGKLARNLVFGQFVKALGSLSGPIIPVVAAMYFGASWRVIFPVYSAALLVAILAATTLRIRRHQSSSKVATPRSCLNLLRNGYVLSMTVAIFLYVGAEVCVSASIPLLLKEQFSVDITKVGLLGTGLFFTALTLGRLFGGLILNWIAPWKFLNLSCAISLAGLFGLFAPVKSIAVGSLVLAGVGFANIFPLVFSAALERMPNRTSEISGLMVTAIVGGAFLPPLMGLVADHTSVRAGFLVPISAIAYVYTTALRTSRDSKS
jgi:MFS transporter, FHS family, L-fucose permease